MLTSTFCHVPGIGLQTERTLWAAGIQTWNTFLECAERISVLSPKREKAAKPFLSESVAHLRRGNVQFFAELLPADQHWRLFPEFRDSVVYLDIETTGMGAGYDHITAIALYDGHTVRSYVHGQNLHDFRQDLGEYRVIVTYNGKCFDIPFIRQSLRIPVDQVHIDLRYVLKSLGYGGGLKVCERNLGIERGDLDGVDGFFAVLLWDDYVRNGNEEALQTLLAYNAQDVVNLERLMVLAYNMKLRQTPLCSLPPMPAPDIPEIPFKADRKMIETIKGRLFY